MKIDEALKETGMAHRGEHAVVYAKEISGVLTWFSKGTDEKFPPMLLSDILNENWQPYHKEPVIMPEKAPELWQYGADSYAIGEDYNGLFCVWLNGQQDNGIDRSLDKMIHGQNGWTRIHPSVPNEDVERIEIEGVTDVAG